MLPRQSATPGIALWEGLTDNYLRVHAAAPAAYDLRNKITATRILRLENGELQGEILELPVTDSERKDHDG